MAAAPLLHRVYFRSYLGRHLRRVTGCRFGLQQLLLFFLTGLTLNQGGDPIGQWLGRMISSST